MQLLINIPKEEYTRWVTDGEIDAFIVRDALRNGIPLIDQYTQESEET